MKDELHLWRVVQCPIIDQKASEVFVAVSVVVYIRGRPPLTLSVLWAAATKGTYGTCARHVDGHLTEQPGAARGVGIRLYGTILAHSDL